MKRIWTKLFSRLTLTAAFILVQILALVLALDLLGRSFAYFYGVCAVLSALLVLYIVNRDGPAAYKIAWIIPIMLLPVFGSLLYVVFGKIRLSPRKIRRMERIGKAYGEAAGLFPSALPELSRSAPEAAAQARYIDSVTHTPLFTHTKTEFFPVGEAMYARLLTELSKAERTIFLEFYIIEPGVMWDGIHAILREKAAAGVDVRVLYDDFGTMLRLPEGFSRELEAEGIRCRVFNRFAPVLSSRFNNRDHRKICVIDGTVGFTGGINIADRYINAGDFPGHWLDCGILLRGGGVWGLTMLFLPMWDYCADEAEDLSAYLPERSLDDLPENGYVMPFTDTPLDDEAVGATVYANLLGRAVDYVYINTPYLIIDGEMTAALTTAAKSGVDVRIVLPGVCDSRLVQEMNRSYYPALTRAGVRVYEYAPGMVHAKTFVSDDRFGVVGTINLDYRSLYLHYECAVWMYETDAIARMKAAYLRELEECVEISYEQCAAQSLPTRFYRAVLRLFAPLF